MIGLEIGLFVAVFALVFWLILTAPLWAKLVRWGLQTGRRQLTAAEKEVQKANEPEIDLRDFPK